MRRLAPFEKALVLSLVPLWAICFTLGVKSQMRGTGLFLVGVTNAPDAESHPALNGEFSPLYRSDPLLDSGLRAGDLLLRMGAADLRGVGPLGVAAFASEQANRDGKVDVVFERAGHRAGASLALIPFSALRAPLAISLTFGAAALFLFLRAEPTRFTRALFQAGMCSAIFYPGFGGTRTEFYAWATISFVGVSLSCPLLIRAAQLFPHDIPPKTRWDRAWPWFFVVIGAFHVPMFLLGEPRIGMLGALAFTVLALVSVLIVAHGNYRRSDPIGRRQMKWIVFGVYCGVLPVIVAGSLTLWKPELGWVSVLSWWAYPLATVFLLVSVIRFNLVDIDRVISATASYNVLLVLLVGGGLVVVPRVSEWASAFAGIEPGAGQVALSLLLAGILVPAHRRLRPQIERVFFRDRYELELGIAELLPKLAACADAGELTERVGEELQRLIRPEACVVYAHVERIYAPVFVEGRTVPAAFDAVGPLIETLRQRTVPLALSAVGRRPDAASLDPFERAALETLQAEVVVPVRRDAALAAFICLGPKRSGDVYTSTDLSLLTAVAEKVSAEMQRFDQEVTLREAREMQESLRRYVPGAVADELSSGSEPASGEREVSVLFVDLRGYTSFSESRRAEEIFSTVNRYTETVSEIVRKHGGSVVEFNGDGMMAIFGAPRELAHKERAAVEAGREIVAAVAALAVGGAQQEAAGPTSLSVGVGIATGEAFVGNVQAVDRMIWTAIGNTTNLAARLQSLTRDLDAALVIDRTTWERAEAAAADFEKRSEVSIRGRRATQDVYALSMPPPDPRVEDRGAQV